MNEWNEFTVVISGVSELNVVAYDLNGLEIDDIRSNYYGCYSYNLR